MRRARSPLARWLYVNGSGFTGWGFLALALASVAADFALIPTGFTRYALAVCYYAVTGEAPAFYHGI